MTLAVCEPKGLPPPKVQTKWQQARGLMFVLPTTMFVEILISSMAVEVVGSHAIAIAAARCARMSHVHTASVIR